MAELKLAVLNALITYGIPFVAGILILIMGMILRYGLKLINKYFKVSFLDTLDQRISLGTLALKETIVKDIKEKAADGKITEAEATDALAKAKAALVAELLKQFGADLGSAKDLIGNPIKYLEDKIEEKVFGHKVIDNALASNPTVLTPPIVAASVLVPPANNAAGNPSVPVLK